MRLAALALLGLCLAVGAVAAAAEPAATGPTLPFAPELGALQPIRTGPLQCNGSGQHRLDAPTQSYPMERIHAVAAASCLLWSLVSLAVHLVSRAAWRGYAQLRPTERRQWCNKIACGLHAAVLSAAQARNLFDPVLNADPLHGVTDSHFFWGSVLLGYLVYDTAYSLLFFSLRSGAVMLAHHVVGIAGCAIGVYAKKLALFGLAIEVFFESCNPLLHILGCMRIAGLTHLAAYAALSRAFLAQFFLFRVLISGAYFCFLLHTVLALPQRPWWGWAGVAVYALLQTLNVVWFAKLARMLQRESRGRRARGAAGCGAAAIGAPAVAELAAIEPMGGKPVEAQPKAVHLVASSGQAGLGKAD